MPQPRTPPLGDMPAEEFREAGHKLIDWIADYLENTDRYPVLAQTSPGDTRRALPASPPEQGEPMDAMIADFENIILPGVTHWNHPAFFAYFNSSGSGPGILGELLGSALNVNSMVWKSCPSSSELEDVVLDWLRQMIGLPEDFMGIVTDTGSSSNLIALAAAREAITGLDIRERGLAGRREVPRLRIYASTQTHSSVDKAAIMLGLGIDGVGKIEVDDEFRIRPDKLEEAIKEDLAAGWLPFAVVATIGTTSTTSVDPVAAVADICAEHDLWLHVDAAYAGSAAILPEYRHIMEGCERADSFVFNPHKWLFTPIDFSALYTRRPERIRAAFSLVPEYLRTPEDPEARNYMEYGVQLGRRFRAIKMWFVLRYFGREGLRARLRRHVKLAQDFAGQVDAHPDFERVGPAPFAFVAFRARPRDLTADDELTNQYLKELNEMLMDSVNDTGEAYLSHTAIGSIYTLRFAIGHLRTEQRHIDRAWQLLQEHAARLDAEIRPPRLRK